MVLEISLYMTLHKIIGQKSLSVSRAFTLGIRDIESMIQVVKEAA